MHSGGGGTGGHRCPPNAHRRHREGDGVREIRGDIPSSCGVTRFHSVSMAMRQPEGATDSVAETASGKRIRGGGTEGGGSVSERVTTPLPAPRSARRTDRARTPATPAGCLCLRGPAAGRTRHTTVSRGPRHVHPHATWYHRSMHQRPGRCSDDQPASADAGAVLWRAR